MLYQHYFPIQRNKLRKYITKCKKKGNAEIHHSTQENHESLSNVNNLSSNMEINDIEQSSDIETNSNMESTSISILTSTLTNKIRYLGDLTDNKLKNMFQDKTAKIIKMLKRFKKKS